MEKAVCGGFYYDSSALIFTKSKGRNVLKVRPTIEKVAPYLYEVEYASYDYQEGMRFVEKYKPSMCSVVRKGNIIGRNFDWYYGDEAQFVVKTKATQGRHATIGVAHSNISDAKCTSGEWDDYYNVLPFMVGDCVNDAGVYANINVVTAGDKGMTTGTNSAGQDLCQIMIPRYVCDYADSAKQAIDLLKDMNIFAPLKGLETECHVMICDSENTYIVEFIYNQMVVFSSTDNKYPPIPNGEIMTNFYLHGWNGEIKSVSLGDSVEEVQSTGLNEHAMGLERYYIAKNKFASIASESDMQNLMAQLKYTYAYDGGQEPFWHSEFNGGDLTIYSKFDDYNDIVDKAIEHYESGARDKVTWYTAHTSIYNIADKKLSVFVDEDYQHKFEFKLHIAGKLD